MAGAGTMPAGTGPFGLGTPAEVEAPPTGPAGVRWLNPNTRDFEQDEVTGQLKQMPELRHRVLMILMTEVGSSTVLPDLGVRRPRKITPGFERDTELAVRKALYQLTDVEQRMTVDQVLVERDPNNTGRLTITVQYTDLETAESDAVQVNG